MQVYLIDSSSLITPFHQGQLKALAVGLQLPSTRDAQAHLEAWFKKGFTKGLFWVPLEVYEEVVANRKDKPAAPGTVLLRGLGKGVILNPPGAFFDALVEVHKFVVESFPPEHAQSFLDPKRADPVLVALARVTDSTLITEEKQVIPQVNGATGKVQKPSLPYVAFRFGERCISLMAALREIR
ncbi:DUF4411 family protein [Candidatus Bipolaricaulota bacterium]|nr:DUF4411 family protein [Candidatus Bipolaricaulota bacterium]